MIDATTNNILRPDNLRPPSLVSTLSPSSESRKPSVTSALWMLSSKLQCFNCSRGQRQDYDKWNQGIKEYKDIWSWESCLEGKLRTCAQKRAEILYRLTAPTQGQMIEMMNVDV